MHGTGNAFLLLDAFRDPPPSTADLPALARAACAKTTGFGTDGLLTVEPAEDAAARMRVFNADGSTAEMCGNGLRCVARLVADRGYAGNEFVIATDAGPRRVEVLSSNGDTSQIRLSLGRPVFDPTLIPTTLPGRPPLEVPLPLGDLSPSPHSPFPIPHSLLTTCLSMGNPHAVTFVPDPDAAPVETLGPHVERHPAFPNRTNVEFVTVTSPAELRLRVWERGCGETAACGTGAAAAAVAAILTGRSERNVTVRLRGGDLRIDWPADDAEVTLTGDAVTLGEVEWPQS
jgi:diaminopimelate epimerase